MRAVVRRLAERGRAPISSAGFFLTVLFLVGGMLAGYLVLNGNTRDIKNITDGIQRRSAQRDEQLCDQAHINKALTPYVLPKQVRKYINEFLRDINRDQAECNPVVPKHPAQMPRKPKPTPSPAPQPTITRTVVTPSGVRTVTVTKTPHPHKTRHHPRSTPSPKPTSVLCIIPVPSPAPHPGGCK